MKNQGARWFYSSRRFYEARPYISMTAGALALSQVQSQPIYLIYGAVLIGCGAFILHLRFQNRASEIGHNSPLRNIMRRF